MLPRLHLFEFLDQPWLPARLRRYASDYLAHVQNRFGFDRLMARKLGDFLTSCGGSGESHQIVDLGSGAGGPIVGLRRHLATDGIELDVVLTDLHPEAETLERLSREPGVRYLSQPVDATAVPEDLVGTRTLVNALHHLRPEQVRAMFADAAAKAQPIVAFDVVERSARGVLSMLLVPLIVWLITPRLRPHRWSRLVLTYPVPLVPLLCTWDGLVSQLRAYRPEELHRLLPPGLDAYAFDVGTIREGQLRVAFVTGRPVGASLSVPALGPHRTVDPATSAHP